MLATLRYASSSYPARCWVESTEKLMPVGSEWDPEAAQSLLGSITVCDGVLESFYLLDTHCCPSHNSGRSHEAWPLKTYRFAQQACCKLLDGLHKLP